jgi:acyl-CoA thioester hydrolase
MMRSSTQVRVRYAEVDQMGFMYYGNYAMYYEVARAVLIRDAGYPYSEMEKDGTVMPVVKMNCKYLKPARYDDLITIETEMLESSNFAFVTFIHKLYNEQKELIHKAEVILTFYNPVTQKRVPMPEKLKQLVEPFYKN